uniref:Mitochondrial folate transporter/carrier n=1 Tax=Mucochytrium quahogii TaxID=96639 RepID=A0A7S2W927_9STRA|mmetsp:Transcript_16500/g.35998  ORF Transcript_16500/g.35998 Transcript_16500/m.35998 type:complete len:291 (+) Transcript_16500:267-1139(+)
MSKDGGIALGSGLLAGFVTTVSLHPLDLIKTRFQVDETRGKGSLFNRGAGVLKEAYRVSTESGIRGLYRGLLPSVMGSSASWGIYFMLYESLKRTLEPNPGQRLTSMQYLLASAAAGAVTTCFTNPIWLVKTRMELQRPGQEPYRGVVDAFSKIVRTEGIAGLYKGIVPALFLVSNGGVQFMVYEELKIYFGGDSDMGAGQYMLLGAVSKCVASTLTYPTQVVKTRMQQHGSSYVSTLESLRTIVARQGVFGLYQGLIPNLLRVMPSSGLTFATYELCKKYLTGEVAERG